MSLSSIDALGSFIAGVANEQVRMKEDIIPDEINQSIVLTPFDSIRLLEEVSAYKKYYPTNSFILDHPIYGELDSSVLQLDGGYWDGVSNGCLLSLPLDSNDSLVDVSGNDADGELKISASAYYPFRGNADDASTSGNDGTVTGASLTYDHLGAVNNAYRFSNNAHNVTIPNHSSINILDDLTIAFWFTPHEPDKEWGAIIHKGGNSTPERTYTVWYQNTERLYLSIRVGGSSATLYTDVGSVVVGETYHVVFTRNSTSGVINCYLNGVLSNTNTTFTGSAYSGTEDLIFGNRPDSANGFFGDIDEVLIIPTALSGAEVLNLYNYTRNHKLDKPLITKTDSDGNSITGYEFIGNSENVSAGDDYYGNHVYIPTTMLAAGDTYSIYMEVMPVSNWASLNHKGNLIGGQYGNTTTLTLSSGLSLEQREDDEVTVGETLLVAGKVNKILVDYSRDGANYTMNQYINGVLSKTSTSTWSDSYVAHTIYLAYEARFKYRFNGVLSKPVVLNRVLTSDERNKLFEGKYPRENITPITLR